VKSRQTKAGTKSKCLRNGQPTNTKKIAHPKPGLHRATASGCQLAAAAALVLLVALGVVGRGPDLPLPLLLLVFGWGGDLSKNRADTAADCGSGEWW